MSYLVLFILAAGVIGAIVGKPYWRELQRERIKQRPFPKAWRKIIQRRMPYFKGMPVDLQLQLKQLIQVFLEEKPFIGKEGMVITDEIRVTIAAQACLLLLNRKTNMYPKLQSILVYPAGFIKHQQVVNSGGVHHAQSTTLIGESWQFGTVVLSWHDTVNGAQIPDDGQNVVIHEFAHQLDQESGNANGAPILDKHQSYESWSQVLTKEFDLLQHQVATGQSSLLDPYGATNPAEFFAVATEVFFEQAHLLQQAHPLLYREFCRYYHLDPLHWH